MPSGLAGASQPYQYFQVAKLQNMQKVAYTGTAGTITNPTALGVNVIRVVCTSDAQIFISTAGTAASASNGHPMTAGVAEYFMCDEASRVSAIQQSAAGTLYVSECAPV